jgi:two-component system, NarL family, nitrate/nitrite response regulator NarL
MISASLVVIETNKLFREGLRHIFSASSFEIVHEAGSVEDAIPFVESLQPALVLVGLPDSDDVTTRVSQIRAAAPRTRIVILADSIRMNRLADAMTSGVDGYLLKNMSADALHQSLRIVLLGEKVFPTELANLLTGDRLVSRSKLGATRHLNGLSDREMQILGYLREGAQNKQIANDLKISDGTVKAHLKAILKKIHVQNRTQAALWALAHGIAKPSETQQLRIVQPTLDR